MQNYNINKINKVKTLVILISIISCVTIVIIITLSKIENKKENRVIIDNFDLVNNLPTDKKIEIEKNLYSYVLSQNNINQVVNKKYYYGTIRPDSLTTENDSDYEDFLITSFIFDIEELQYSYEAEFMWSISPNTTSEMDTGSTTLYCLSDEDMIYGNFNCSSNPVISIKQTDIWSIDYILDEDCWISPFSSSTSISGYGIKMYYHPSDADYRLNTINSSFDNCMNRLENHIESNGLPIENYELIKEIKYFYNY